MKVLSTLICLSLSAVVSARAGAQSLIPRPHHNTSVALSAQASTYAIADVSQAARIAPNFVFSSTQIQVEHLMNKQLDYKVYDQLGSVVLEGTLDNAHSTIAIAELAADKYYLQLLDETICTQVFVKE